MSYVIPRHDICMSDAMPFSQHWEARVPVSIADIKNFGTALQTVYSSIRPGDLFNICSMERVGGQWGRLKEIVTLRIVDCENNKIETIFVTDILKVKENRDDPAHVKNSPLEVVKVGSAFEVRDVSGNVLEAFVEEKQAIDFRDRHGPSAVALAPNVDRSKWTISRGFQGRHIVKNETGEIVREFRKREHADAFIATGIAPEQEAA